MGMKLEKVIIENFRSYQNRITIDFNDLTAFVGKNDIGKSTILEALEIFFNNKNVKISKEDKCVYSEDSIVRIGCAFSNIPETPIVIDSSAPTTLENEFLLNEEGFLEIHKLYDCSKSTITPNVMLVANYPDHELFSGMVNFKQADYTTLLKKLEIDKSFVDDLRSNVSIRKAIFKHTEFKLTTTEMALDRNDGKSIWEKLKNEIPLYSLFQSDRPSLDGDSEVQDPMKLAVKQALQDVEQQLNEIKDKVMDASLKVANATVEKLNEMDSSLATQLSPHFIEEPKWANIFKLSLDGDNNIPINKRGSGVRRLILLNFFRAEAERKQKENSKRGIIYAIEEPETAQHPNNQVMLAEALIQLSEIENTQVILTTHVPGFAGLLPIETMRYITTTEIGKDVINSSEEGLLKDVADALGVLPSLEGVKESEVKVLICVEGIHDVTALKVMSKLLHSKDDSLIDLSVDKRAVMIPTGGSTLRGWVEHQYLKSFSLPEIHIYDGDGLTPPKYDKQVQKVISWGNGSYGYSTKKRELENYIHPKAIKAIYGFDLPDTDDLSDIPSIVAELTHLNSDSTKLWIDVKDEKRKQKESNAKKTLNTKVIEAMDYEMLIEMDKYGEIKEWIKKISSLCQEKVTS
jgi:putative ATP-dependent endonuclease of the OLD family